MLLKFLRNKKTMKRIMWGIAIIIIPAFVIWGSGSSDKEKKKGLDCAGRIFNKKISYSDYADMWYVTRDNLAKSMGRDIPSRIINDLTWNRILLLEAAKRNNITVKDSEVFDYIISVPAFNRDGKFDKGLYKSMLGDSAQVFEEKIRDEIRIGKLRYKISASVYLSDEEIKDAYKKRFEKIKASYVSIPFSDFEKDVQYQDKSLEVFYDSDKELFRKPETRNIEYIETLFSSFNDQVFIDDEAINKYFDAHIKEFKSSDSEEKPLLTEEIKKEIHEKLLKEKASNMAEELAYKILDKAIEKKDLSRSASLFGASVKETGLFSQQDKIPEIGLSYDLTKTSFDLENNEIWDKLVKTDTGFYVVRLKDKKDSFIPAFLDIKNEVIAKYTIDAAIALARKKTIDDFDKIVSGIKEGRPFETLSQELSLEIKTTDLITRDDYITSLGPAKEFVDAASLLEKGQVSTPI